MRHRTWTEVIIGGAVAAAVTSGLAGCGTNPHRAALLPARCGSAVTHSLDGSTRALSADPGALTCFAAAARGCRAAGIEITEMGTDTGTNFVFTVGPGKTTCQVTERSQAYSANFGGSAGPATTVACRLAAVSGAGVTLGCGGRDMLIPSAVSPRLPLPPSGRSLLR